MTGHDLLTLDALRHAAEHKGVDLPICPCCSLCDATVEYGGRLMCVACRDWFYQQEDRAEAEARNAELAQRDADEDAEVLSHYEIARLSKEREP